MYITTQAVESIVREANERATAGAGPLNSFKTRHYLWCVIYSGVLADNILSYKIEDWQNAYDAIAKRCEGMDLVAKTTNALIRQAVKTWHKRSPMPKLKKSWRRVKGSAV